MQISEISNKDELSSLIINELKDIGVKYRKDKKSKVVQEKACRKRIFRTHLHLLELTDVILAHGSVVQIPKFVSDACNRILEQVEIEGVFRKAGSTIRQKEIRVNLEAGWPLGKSHHVIDVANLLKSFFRELPEPLIPISLQETLLRSLLIGENHTKAILLTCLLLPPLTINTLAFFMQFLHTVSQSSHLNKMSVENLAIILTPGIMPHSDVTSARFNNHVKMVQLLIENAYAIGTIPDFIINKLQIHEVVSNTPSKSRSFEALEIVTQKKKKKRRSGSLNQIFSGIRKMVGSAIGSSENLENSPEWNTANFNAFASYQEQIQNASHSSATPRLKPKKRKFAEPVCTFSAKNKESKKSRSSLAGHKHIKNISKNPVVTSMDRRWSIVGSGWSISKKSSETKKDNIEKNNLIPETKLDQSLNLDISRPYFSKMHILTNENPIVENLSVADIDTSESFVELSGSDYVRIPKNEYQAIKERVAAIETRISQEFGSLCKTVKNTSFLAEKEHGTTKRLSGPECVENKYKQIVTNTVNLTSPSTEHLAQRLSRELYIRRPSENRVMRSPSARKIGTIRRRSQEKVRLARNQTWHVGSSANKPQLSECKASSEMPRNCFYSKINLKRGQPNTIATGLYPQHCAQANNAKYKLHDSIFNENWIDGENFFSVLPPASVAENRCTEMQVQRCDNNCTPVKQNFNHFDNIKTPMLPPKSLPRKISKTPNSSISLSSAGKNGITNSVLLSTTNSEDANGRASIARLRAQNAGMVMAKAKLFDRLGHNHSFERDKTFPIANEHESIHDSNLSCKLFSDDLWQQNNMEILRKNSTAKPGLLALDSECSSEEKTFKPESALTEKHQKNKKSLNTVLSQKSLVQAHNGCDSLNICNFTNKKPQCIPQSATSTKHKAYRINPIVLNNTRNHSHIKSIQRKSPRQIKTNSNIRKPS